MKKIIALSIALLLVAGSAYALEIQNSGMMYVRGSLISQAPGTVIGNDVANDADTIYAAGQTYLATPTEANGLAFQETLTDAGIPEEEAAKIVASSDPEKALKDYMNEAIDYGYLDMELDMTTHMVLSDSTSIHLQYEIHDQNYGGTFLDQRTYDDSQLDDNIDIYRAFMSHEFSTGTIIRAGLMPGAGWSWDFGNNSNGFYRAHVQQKIAPGIIGYVYTKEGEEGASNPLVKDANKDDGDQHAVYGILKFGDMAVQPLLVYWPGSDVIKDRGGDGRSRWLLDVGVGGPMGPVGFEAEVAYSTWNADDGAESNGEDNWSTYGAYLNVWGDMGPAKIGGMLAYGSYDKDAAQGYGFGADFCPTVVGADWMNIGSASAPYGDTQYFAVSFAQLYASLAISEPFSINGSLTYWQSNEEDTIWEDSTGYEFDLGCAYKITNMVTYTVAAGYADVSFDDDKAGDLDPDSVYRIYHKLQVNF